MLASSQNIWNGYSVTTFLDRTAVCMDLMKSSFRKNFIDATVGKLPCVVLRDVVVSSDTMVPPSA